MRLISWNVNGRYGPALDKQVSGVVDREPDLVALQEVRSESVGAWRGRLADFGLRHVVDSSALLGIPGPTGKDYRRRYFNLVASRWPLHLLPPIEIAFPERYIAARVEGPELGFELHNAHLPPGSTRGLIKVEMFEALFGRLATGTERRILCGDFNTPRRELRDGSVEFWGSRHGPDAARWDDAERSVVTGLADHGLPDLFRGLNGYDSEDASWVHQRGDRRVGRRYDHIFAAPSLNGTVCRYLHVWRQEGLSDHSAIEADFALLSS